MICYRRKDTIIWITTCTKDFLPLLYINLFTHKEQDNSKWTKRRRESHFSMTSYWWWITASEINLTVETYFRSPFNCSGISRIFDVPFTTSVEKELTIPQSLQSWRDCCRHCNIWIVNCYSLIIITMKTIEDQLNTSTENDINTTKVGRMTEWDTDKCLY